MAQPCSQALSKLMDHWIWLLSFVFLPFLLPYSPLEMGQGMSRNQNKQNLPKFKLMHKNLTPLWCNYSVVMCVQYSPPNLPPLPSGKAKMGVTVRKRVLDVFYVSSICYIKLRQWRGDIAEGRKGVFKQNHTKVTTVVFTFFSFGYDFKLIPWLWYTFWFLCEYKWERKNWETLAWNVDPGK